MKRRSHKRKRSTGLHKGIKMAKACGVLVRKGKFRKMSSCMKAKGKKHR